MIPTKYRYSRESRVGECYYLQSWGENTRKKQTWRWVPPTFLIKVGIQISPERDGWGQFGTQGSLKHCRKLPRDVRRTLQGSIYWNWHESRLETMCCEVGKLSGRLPAVMLVRLTRKLLLGLWWELLKAASECPASPTYYHCIARKVWGWQDPAPAS